MSKYFKIEFPEETVRLISEVCEIYGGIIAGDVVSLQDVVINAYEKRMNRKVPDQVRSKVMDLIKELVCIGWDSTCSVRYSHRFSEDSDTLFDVSEVLKYQFAILDNKQDSYPEPPHHWNKSVGLCRVTGISESESNRRKQLRIVQNVKQ